MSQRIAHRGPDDADTWRDSNGECMLTFRRLAILDLSETGRQPMQSPDHRWTITFNGEIYNYAEIKLAVESSGKYPHPFRGHSDTEVLLAAICIWGVEEAIQKANGMFAFAAWDSENRKLFLSRDRFGEKPLYYANWKGAWIFGSEIKALQGYPGTQFRIDESALQSYFRFGYFSAPHTIFREVTKLTPGYYLELADGQSVVEKPYWSVEKRLLHARENAFKGTLEEAETHFEKLLKDSVQKRMISDVPLGAFLSGGMDSSLVVAMMQKQSSKPIQTFSIGFTEQAYNEAPYAKKVSEHLGTDHTEWVISPKEAQEIVPQLGDIYDEPLSDPSQVPTLLVSALARKKVTVALSGDAGDELFGGYDRYRWADSVQNTLGRSPKFVQQSLGKLIGLLPTGVWETAYQKLQTYLPPEFRWNNPTEKLNKLALVLSSGKADEIYRALVSQWPQPEMLVSKGQEYPSGVRAGSIPPKINDLVSRMMYFDLTTYLADDVLQKVDRASMSKGLEVRVPLLDPQIVEFAWSLPVNWKLHRGQTKILLRKVLKHHFPENFFRRPKKGFSLPVDVWLRTGLRDWAESILSEEALRESGYLNIPLVRKYWKEHLSGNQNHQYKLWSVLQFQTWFSANKS